MTQATKPQRQPGAAALARLQNSQTPRLWITDLDGQRLRDLRRQHGLSQGALADQAGISLTTVAWSGVEVAGILNYGRSKAKPSCSTKSAKSLTLSVASGSP
jgi:hypothetical protein